MKKITVLTVVLTFCLCCFGQVRSLRIGDTLPDIKLDSVKNHPQGRLNLSEFRGKWLMLDFWFGACPSCIELFPKMEKLQKKFEGKLAFLLVNFESSPTIEASFRRWKKLSASYRWPELPCVISDTVLQQLFPHQYYPHEVWIDPQGVVRAFTGPEAVTPENIQAAVTGRMPAFEMKYDLVDYDDRARPLLSQLYPLYPERLRYYSSVMKYVPGISGGLTRSVTDTAAHSIRITRRNMSILQLFSEVLAGESEPMTTARFDFGKRVILEVKDSSRYLFQEGTVQTRGEWQKENCYSYELVLPLASQGKLKAKMCSDLEAYFDVSCRLEKRMLPAWTLVRTADSNRLLSPHTIPADTGWVQLKKIIMPWFLEKIAAAHQDSPELFADGTGYTGRLSIGFEKAMLRDIPRLRSFLREQYGLDLVEKLTEVEVLVLSEGKERIPPP